MKKIKNKDGISNNFKDIYNLLYVGLMGCNNEIKNLLNSYYKDATEFSNPTFFFYEYFLNEPIPFSQAIFSEKFEEYYLLAPFIQRLAKKNPYGYNPLKPVKGEIITFKDVDLALSKVVIKLSHSLYLKSFIETWLKGIIPNHNDSKIGASNLKISIIDHEKIKILFGKIENYKKTLIDDYEWRASQIHDDAMSKKSMMLESGFVRTLICPLPNNNKPIPAFVIPVASSHFFYGELMFWLPGIVEENKFHDFKHKLIDIISNYYLPALCIIFEHHFENKYPNPVSIKEEIPFIQYNKSSSFMPPCCLEKNISSLWNKRLSHKIDYLSSLVFKDYLIASPQMIKLTTDIIAKASSLQRNGSSLPSVLIVGGAGSGKNDLINFLKVFSFSYCNGDSYYINMAGIKPDSDISGILMGTNDKSKEFPGIISEIRKNTIRKFMGGKTISKIKDSNEFPTLIFDEFNSLNIDSQGILLRFIENSEIIKIGAIEDSLGEDKETNLLIEQILREKKNNVYSGDDIKKFFNNFLVVGIMNEDPDELSREKAIEFITRNKYISGIVGDLLYEQIMNIRRLRPDIKYRMIRGGKFVVPQLKDRRYDIPILFYLFLKKEVEKKTSVIKDIFITLNSLEKLISPDIEWPGNIRQLQAMVKIISEHLDTSIDLIIVKEKVIDFAINELGLNCHYS